MIDRRELVGRHNPVLTRVNTESPLTVGNGSLAFTADITGFQTLYDEYTSVPLCTMSEWGWHTKPDGGRCYEPSEIEMTYYSHNGRKVSYASEIQDGNEKVYDWLRKNPHRLNLVKIALLWDGEAVSSEDITDIRQTLDLFRGVITSEFKLFGHKTVVETVCGSNKNVLGFSIKSAQSERLSVSLSFPYGSHKITACDWSNTENHDVSGKKIGDVYVITHKLDDDIYYTGVGGNPKIIKREGFTFTLSGDLSGFTVSFSENPDIASFEFSEIMESSEEYWAEFWENGGAVDFKGSHDRRAYELERRIVLSQYQIAVNSAGNMPPAETGLVCNSWYGKFHLEMHILHSGWLPLWGKARLLEKSLPWYERILEKAAENASRNGNKGVRWVKMTDPRGVDSPSRIAVLLIWQQPHIIYMLDLIQKSKNGTDRSDFMQRYAKLVFLTADFMADFPVLNENSGFYDLLPPIIPAQEEHKPEDVKNPAFELCYWRFGLKTAVKWASELGMENEQTALWRHVGDNMALPPVHDGVYTAHENCPDTFLNYNRDHPSMLFGYGFLDGFDIDGVIDADVMNKTVDRVLDEWDFRTCWGWDFALMAMTLAKLGRMDEAIDVLLMDTEKNYYADSGNNYQRGRTDLPLYLPGNGSLLFAMAYILKMGFPKNSMWNVKAEKIIYPD